MKIKTNGWNLSDKLTSVFSHDLVTIKEFIRRLKDDLYDWVDHDDDDLQSIMMIVDSLAGKKLI